MTFDFKTIFSSAPTQKVEYTLIRKGVLMQSSPNKLCMLNSRIIHLPHILNR